MIDICIFLVLLQFFFQNRDALFDPVIPEDSSFVFAHLHFKENQLRIDAFSKDLMGFPSVDVMIFKQKNLFIL